MSIAETFLPEFDQEMANTRKVLERIPEDKFDWKCHPKSNTIGWVSNHVAEIPSWVPGTLNSSEWDYHPPGGEPYQSPKFSTRKEILEFFDKGVAEARQAIAATSDEEFAKDWSLLYQGNVIFKMSRAAVVRSVIINHTIHHRAILTVYLRLNDVPVPGMYGPSGDE